MKDFPVSTNYASFVERLKQLSTTLFNFLDWFTPTHPFIADKRARTFLISFTILFFELFCIQFQLIINSTQVLYYGISEQSSQENFLVLPLIFGMVTLCFIPLSRAFGKLFAQLPPLTAYTYDIIGSLAGIAAFSAMSYFTLPPVAWFSALCVLLLLLSAKRTVLFVAVVLAATLIEVGRLQVGAYWSPYYKIILQPLHPSGYLVDVNGTGHQQMIPWQKKEPFYKEVYRIFGRGSFHHALILGAGTGSDTAIALAYGVDSITAVEIDPTIHQLGAQLNPDHPYSNPRVHVVINDGRSFLQNTTDHYDLIIFALPDSLTLTSNNTSLRLESFLLTQDALATARTHLTSNGTLVLYNYYRFNWLVQKLSDMVGNVFHQQPLVTTYGGAGRAAAIMAGPRLATLPPGEFGPYHEKPTTDTKKLSIIGQGYFPLTSATPATDDWPFLYLQDRSFPTIYILGLAMVAFYALIGTVTFAPRKTLRRFDWHMFFLGMAFMLLEVKSLTTFSLLFGTTWLVNSLVFFAILSSVLLAILVNRRFKFKRISVFYLLLFGILLLNLLLPPEALLLSNLILRYVLASVLAFTPVFLANIIFTNSFRDSETADIAFASNLLGIMVGGGLEYFSMLFGYRLLLIPVMVFYACALLLRLRSRRTTGASEEAVASEPVLASQ